MPVIAQLTRNERQQALWLLLIMTGVGLMFLVAGKDDPIGMQGVLIMAVSIASIFALISGYFLPEPTEDRRDSYYDEPIKIGIIISLMWAAVGMLVGDWVAWLLAYPDLTFDAGWSSFGRLRPVHTSGVIFGFGGNALIEIGRAHV